MHEHKARKPVGKFYKISLSGAPVMRTMMKNMMILMIIVAVVAMIRRRRSMTMVITNQARTPRL